MPSPLLPLLAVSSLAAVGAHLLMQKTASAAPALPAAMPAAMPVAMPAAETGPAPEPEAAPSDPGSSGSGGGGGGSSDGGSAAAAPAASTSTPMASPIAQAPAAVRANPLQVAKSYNVMAPTMSSLGVTRSVAVATVPRMPTRSVAHGDFGADTVQSFAKENPAAMLAVAGSGGLLGWMFAKSIGAAVLGAALAPVAVALAVTKLVDKGIG